AVICLLLAPLMAGAAAAQDGNLAIVGPAGEMILTPEQLQALPQRELTEQPTNFPKPGRFRGPSLADVLAAARAAGKDAKLTALDDYQVTITADEMAQHNPILAVEVDGETLIGHDFGPYFVMWPFREKPEIDNEAFQSKAIWQVIKIEVQ
ncbi:MAG TPA: hypothetical protein VG742_02480, partial [Dongiaceae bacterium]|nr:hypothetical protein [Dongiaceae bacterium]